jgi:hypothetical protein
VGAPWGYMLGELPSAAIATSSRAQAVAAYADLMCWAPGPAGWRYNVQGMSSKLGMFLFGAAALAHVTMASTGEAFRLQSHHQLLKPPAPVLQSPSKGNVPTDGRPPCSRGPGMAPAHPTLP